MHFELIADRPDAIPIVGRWYFEQWGHLAPDSSFERICIALRGSLNRAQLPLILLAIEGQEIVGAAELKPHEMLGLFPDREPWLGGVFVHPDYRNRGVATQLTLRVLKIAESLGLQQLYLQTEKLSGGLYARLGWESVQQVNYRGHDVLVMEKRLIAPDSK
jgi:GNAT superfamily N-acetyltransferase